MSNFVTVPPYSPFSCPDCRHCETNTNSPSGFYCNQQRCDVYPHFTCPQFTMLRPITTRKEEPENENR